jgi:dehydrogenase/reductase SDR family protein 7B
MNSLTDNIVLITGASSGIGRAAAIRLAQLGCRIALAARTRSALDEVAHAVHDAGSTALVIPTDVTRAEDCENAVETTVAHFGRLDVLLCSAGLSMRGPFEDSDLAAVARVMQVNFFGTLYATHFALPHIKASRGSLVAISSLTGKRGIPSYAMYGASKFAIQGLYEALRVEMKPHGVHVGVVSPGFVATPLRDKVMKPDGTIWEEPPAPPFRIRPVETCVRRIVTLIRKRQPEALIPWFTGPLLTMDKLMGSWLGDRLLLRRFRNDSSKKQGS